MKMKKMNVLNLIKYYSEKNDGAFRTEAYDIARDFDKCGDHELAEYIMALLSNTNTFILFSRLSSKISSFANFL